MPQKDERFTHVTDDVSGGPGCQHRNGIFGKVVAFIDGVHVAFTVLFLEKGMTQLGCLICVCIYIYVLGLSIDYNFFTN